MPPPFVVAIPARYAASRLPGKPLRLLGGEPLVRHVARRALGAGAQQVWVAADDPRIAAAGG
ncbi:cytidylyltransferase domain-containing protein, partial [Xanthomonas translucens]|uniref:cytidylyltransferase domain-containing protein n=1 Tax=Xanthomonas campestris pv. translucens TaxID=343 RepID=UPI003CCE561C